MGKVGTYFHDSLNVTPVASIGTTFDVTKFHLHDLIPDQTFPNSAPNRFPGVTRKTLFNNRIEGLHVRLTSDCRGRSQSSLAASPPTQRGTSCSCPIPKPRSALALRPPQAGASPTRLASPSSV
jgi:hypothetical protein